MAGGCKEKQKVRVWRQEATNTDEWAFVVKKLRLFEDP
jgi:hypothetical protein